MALVSLFTYANPRERINNYSIIDPRIGHRDAVHLINRFYRPCESVKKRKVEKQGKEDEKGLGRQQEVAIEWEWIELIAGKAFDRLAGWLACFGFGALALALALAPGLIDSSVYDRIYNAVQG